MRNAEIAALLRHAADAIEAQGGNPYRARAYARAAARIEAWPHALERWVKEGRDLTEVPGVGEAIAAKVREAVETGSLATARRVTLAAAPRTGTRSAPKAGRAAWRRRRGPSDGPVLRPFALAAAEDVRAWLATLPGVRQVAFAGELRRATETVGALAFVALADPPGPVLDAFADAEFLADGKRGPSGVTGRLASGLGLGLWAADEAGFARAWLEATGPTEHAHAVLALATGRRPARARTKKVVTNGGVEALARPEALGGAEALEALERDLYARARLAWVPPELRDDPDSVALAARHAMPALVTVADLKGDLHTHTDATDGRASLETMVDAAVRLGLSYIVITDHTQRTTIAGGLKPEEMRRHLDKVERYARKRDDIDVLLGAEVDILKGGRLDLPPDLLARLDVAVCSLHHRERQDGAELTRRILLAMANKHADVLGHPTGRLLGKRPSMELDLERILEAARDQGWAVELDGQADRLDLPHPWVRRAKELRVPVALDSDAHRVREFANLARAVEQARRGWLEAPDVLNARDAKGLRAWLESR